MAKQRILGWTVRALQVLAIAGCFYLALHFRTPSLASVRSLLIWAIPLGFLTIAGADVLWPRSRPKDKWRLSWGMLVLCVAGLSIYAVQQGQFLATKQFVLSQSPKTLERFGAHLVVGYRRQQEIDRLIDKKAIAGVFLTARNLQGKAYNEIQQGIVHLQGRRQATGLSPLWIAADQEGGIVSRLSPPLTHLPPISQVVANRNGIERQQAVQDYAAVHGQELADLGVNLNFAPVVDLNRGQLNPNDRLSQIFRRAIASDGDTVAAVSRTYCQTLADYGVRCTLKHFPGLGRVVNDTHLRAAELTTPVATLHQADWLPFRPERMADGAFTMLGHATLTALDPDHPASFSPAVVQALLRQGWQHAGVFITDDFSMGAVYDSREGVVGATIKALNSGVDLILLSYDPDLVYPVIAGLLQADQAGQLDDAQLVTSRDRLHQNQVHLRVQRQAHGSPNVIDRRSLTAN